MKICHVLCTTILALTCLLVVAIATSNQSKLAIVYAFTIHNNTCHLGMPGYVQHTLHQAVWNQPDADVYLLSNFADCSFISSSLGFIHGIVKVDVNDIMSNRTRTYKNISAGMFMSDAKGELWYESAFRFFYLEDFMTAYKITEMIHFEADNVVYGPLTAALPELRKYYPHLAVTPLAANKNALTASALWVASPASLILFNDFLLALAFGLQPDAAKVASDTWAHYLHWLHRWAACQRCGWYRGNNGTGDGIKPFAFNEMTMMAFYHYIKPEEFLNLLPVVPVYDYYVQRPYCNMSLFSSQNPTLGRTGDFIWDSGSWGQYLGGTENKHGRNRGFKDMSHVVGQAIGTNGCIALMLCSNTSYPVRDKSAQHPTGDFNRISNACYTMPHVRCEKSDHWTPLHNLHVHSKHTKHFISHLCDCGS